MFTGLVEAVGKVLRVGRRGGGAKLRVSAPFAGELERGESVSLNGVCQTVVSADAVGFEIEAVEQTLAVTSIGGLAAGDRVNLERALRMGDRLGGHMVTGHIDGVGRVASLSRGRGTTRLSIEVPAELLRHIVPRGSIAIDGVSLTVAEVTDGVVEIALIEETLEATVASDYRAGTRVNIETDLVAKHQEKLLAASEGGEAPAKRAGITERRLRELGFME